MPETAPGIPDRVAVTGAVVPETVLGTLETVPVTAVTGPEFPEVVPFVVVAFPAFVTAPRGR
jgi:hypothetical protein